MVEFLWLVLAAALVVAFVVLRLGAKRGLRYLRDHRQFRPGLWNRFYALDWGDTATNNFGYAPSDPDDAAPDRFQRQMYRELFAALRDSGRVPPAGARLLEVSCGRGGGLDAFLEAAGPGAFRATGLDVAASAIDYCRTRWPERREGLDFVIGSAMDLPFPDDSIDVLVNVEASNDYADRDRFLAEVRRVLKPDGTFLYAETEHRKNAGKLETSLEKAGLRFDKREITLNVVEACRLDTPRRAAIVRRAPLLMRLFLGRDLADYAAMEGSRKFEQFATGSRRYYQMVARPA